jgi:hypothetical protein
MNQTALALLIEGADASPALASAAEYAQASKAASTRRVYNVRSAPSPPGAAKPAGQEMKSTRVTSPAISRTWPIAA